MRVIETAGECRHHSLPGQDGLFDLRIACGRAAGQSAALEHFVQIGRDFFQGKVVVTMAMRTSTFVEMFSFSLLRSEFRCFVAAGDGEDRGEKSCMDALETMKRVRVNTHQSPF